MLKMENRGKEIKKDMADSIFSNKNESLQANSGALQITRIAKIVNDSDGM